MKRKDFLKGAGLLGFIGLFDAKKMLAGGPTGPVGGPTKENMNLMACTVSPTETVGPYPWPSGTNIQNSVFWRSDIREPNTAGSGVGCVPLTLKLRVVNVANCTPIPNARVDIWHCNEAGAYSGYGSHAGATWLRGIQQTDNEGFVTFKTIFPGWYNGRITHIHYQVYVAGVLKLTSQLTFPIAWINEINGLSPYSTTPGKPPYGPNPGFPGQNSIQTFAQDNVFSDGTAGEMLNVFGNVDTGLYGNLDVVISYAQAAAAGVNNLNGGLRDGHAMLWWSAEQREQFSHFEVEKSHDWEDFETIARVEGKGPLGTNEHYAFTDPSRMTSETQYRIKIVDTDGNSDCTVYLPLRPGQSAAEIATNPANEHLVVKHPPVEGGEASFTVLSPEGRELLRGPVQFGATASLLEVGSLPKGEYLLAYDDSQRLQMLAFSKK